MQSDTRPDTPREAGRDSRHDGGYDDERPASDFMQGAPDGPTGLAQSAVYRRLAWAGATLLLAATIGASVWAVKTWQTNRAMANVESSITARSLPAMPGNAMPGNAPATVVPERAPDVAAAPAPVSADRLPALVLPGQPVPAAVLRDLPEWVAAEMGPVETSGGSGDESASLAASPAAPPAAAPGPAPAMQQAPARQARSDGYGAVFKRCPGPGQSGAVECRRAVCDGAAKKLAACAPYLK